MSWCGRCRIARCVSTAKRWRWLRRSLLSFLRHSEAAAKRYGLSAVDILVELGKRRMVGGGGYDRRRRAGSA